MLRVVVRIGNKDPHRGNAVIAALRPAAADLPVRHPAPTPTHLDGAATASPGSPAMAVTLLSSTSRGTNPSDALSIPLRGQCLSEAASIPAACSYHPGGPARRAALG